MISSVLKGLAALVARPAGDPIATFYEYHKQ